ncbi:MAG: cytochrome c-type biogenesis protein [Nitrospirota bacterium]
MMIKNIKTFLFIFIVLCFTASTFAVEKRPLSEDEIQLRVRAVSKSLRCAVCQSESVWESGSELAGQMREIVRERVIAGESDEAIRTYFVGRYGDFILLKPRVSGINQLIWYGPFILLATSAIVLYRKMKVWTKDKTAVQSSDSMPLDESGQKKIDAALESFREKIS